MSLIVWGSFILAGAIVLLVIGRPFFEGGGRPSWMPFRDVHGGRDLIAKKESLLRAIKDVEFEFQNGTLSEEDRDVLREDYKRRAVEVIRQIEESGRDTDRQLRQAVEAEVAAEMKAIQDGTVEEIPAGETRR